LSAVAQDRIIGVASVIDGDSIEIHGQRIRLFGIELPAPRRGPLCSCGRRLLQRKRGLEPLDGLKRLGRLI
jgi:endonuclease YncB( thermonuclease family)